MALIDFGEIWDQRGTQYRADFRRGLAAEVVQEKQHVRAFYAETDDPQADGQEVINLALVWPGPGPPLPPVWDPHPNDPNALLATYDAVQKEVPEVWQIRANYSTYLDPTAELAEIGWGGAAQQRVVEGAEAFLDEDGVEHYPTDPGYPALPAGSLYPITNSAFEPFSPPPVEPEPYAILTVVKNFNIPAGPVEIPTPAGGFDMQVVLDNYVFRLNSAAFSVPGVAAPFPVDTVLLAQPPTAKWQFQRGVAFYQTTWVFWIRHRLWYLRAADMGWNQLITPDDASSGRTPIVVGNHQAANQQKLDGHGQALTGGEPVVYLTYRTKKRADFNELLLFAGM